MPSGNRKPAATIYDVARHVGVSPSTVSRGLNKPGRLNPATEAKIRKAAEELGYRINPMARALPTGRTRTLALVVSDLTNPVYFELLRGAELKCAELGYTIVFAESRESAEVEFETIKRVSPSVDGVVVVSSRLGEAELFTIAEHQPIVLVSREVAGLPSVVADPTPGIVDLVDLLAGSEHRLIAYAAGPWASWMSTRRWEILYREAQKRGLSIVELPSSEPTLLGGKAALERVRASGATAAVAFNDLMAIGLLQASREEGILVPEQLSIVGFDDIFGADLTTPALTSIRAPNRRVGEEAVRLVVSELGGPEASATEPLLTELVVRSSTGRRRPA
jgi:LacI family transcriptional regulator